MKKDSLDVLVSKGVKDATGRLVTSWVVDNTIQERLQALKYNVGFMPFGVTDKTSNVVYCKNLGLMKRYFLPKTDAQQFNITYRIGCNSKQYIINSIIPYPKHLEIYLELVI